IVLSLAMAFVAGCATAPTGGGTPMPTPVSGTVTTTPTPRADLTSCTADSDCVPAQCCHPTGCINRAFKGVCTVACTMSCEGPLDCGAGHCGCVAGLCQVVAGPAAEDLTNQNSPLAATFSDGASHTPLGMPAAEIGLQQVTGGLSAPMMLVEPPDGSHRLFIVDQIGAVRVLDEAGKLRENPFLDLRSRMESLNAGYDERGLLSLAFHPDYAANGRLYVYYTAPLRNGAPAGWDSTNRLSEFRVSNDPNMADMFSELILLQVDKPSANHNGGQIRFGPDGYLYLPLGDGGGADDTGLGHTPGTGNGQDMAQILGKVLRIDVDSRAAGKEYGIPADNPFVNDTAIPPEIYASGFRNPAFLSFDAGDGHRLLVADAGQRLFEEFSIVLPGGNYGWNIREGTHCFDPDHDSAPKPSCATTGSRGEPLIGPVFEGGHDLGLTIVGGHLYRGSALPSLQGKYVFGYWSEGEASTGNGALLMATPPSGWTIDMYPTSVAALSAAGNQMWTGSEIPVSGMNNQRVNAFIRGFGEDSSHELYLLTSERTGPDSSFATGKVWKLVPASSVSP
ncbi:MAG: PQQ-dependent sugar dehydrogenase, partial [Methanomicrobiales archaeon]|nr:PQQ-dependent sugar dehydrogenase [Methanomicrobiales archaeon]